MRIRLWRTKRFGVSTATNPTPTSNARIIVPRAADITLRHGKPPMRPDMVKSMHEFVDRTIDAAFREGYEPPHRLVWVHNKLSGIERLLEALGDRIDPTDIRLEIGYEEALYCVTLADSFVRNVTNRLATPGITLEEARSAHRVRHEANMCREYFSFIAKSYTN